MAQYLLDYNMITKLEQHLAKREEIAKKIAELQKERKRLNNAISRIRNYEKTKKSIDIV